MLGCGGNGGNTQGLVFCCCCCCTASPLVLLLLFWSCRFWWYCWLAVWWCRCGNGDSTFTALTAEESSRLRILLGKRILISPGSTCTIYEQGSVSVVLYVWVTIYSQLYCFYGQRLNLSFIKILYHSSLKDTIVLRVDVVLASALTLSQSQY